MNGLAIAAAVVVGVITFCLFVARFIRVGAEKEMPTPPVPTRLDPRAGQNASRAAHTTFTALLALAVVLGVGVVQDFIDAGGVQ